MGDGNSLERSCSLTGLAGSTPAPSAVWYVYIIECQTGTWYCGATNNLERRFKQHAEGKGSKYIRGQGGPKKFVFYRRCLSKPNAFSEEQKMKRLTRAEKKLLIEGSLNELSNRDLLLGGAPVSKAD